jgi:hypothetical protein
VQPFLIIFWSKIYNTFISNIAKFFTLYTHRVKFFTKTGAD